MDTTGDDTTEIVNAKAHKKVVEMLGLKHPDMPLMEKTKRATSIMERAVEKMIREKKMSEREATIHTLEVFTKKCEDLPWP